MLKTNPFWSFTYNVLLGTAGLRKVPLLSKFWNRAWRWQNTSYKGLVKSTLHGQPVILTNGHWYSLVCRLHPTFNQPLFALLHAITNQSNQAVRVIDVGAAVGDTVLFLEANFPDKIERYLCVDGDTEFFSFQDYNLRSVAGKSINFFTLLSDKQELTSSIDKKDPTTGSAIGHTKEMSKTLDDVVAETGFGRPDVIKIDIDGFDGKAIGGATNILKEYRPYLIFEWNTPLFELVGNDIFQPFEVLQKHGYDRFIWFTNLGYFSHIEKGFNKVALEEMAAFQRHMHVSNGHHFDVIALHESHPITAESLALINETIPQKSPY